MTADAEIVFRRVSPQLESELADFFALLTRYGVDRTFHPHPFDEAEARRRASYRGRDEYHVAIAQGEVIAYGMLRGWDDGYDVPSLGVAVHPEWQQRGVGRRMMRHLHDVARERGAERVRLKVYAGNDAAISLYSDFGYQFVEEERGQRVGVVSL